MKALVVEDNLLLGKSIKRGMQERGWTVDLAMDGTEALYCIQESSYDLIILDWMLPKLSGIDVLATVRSGGNTLPIIMITAKDAVTNRVHGLESGADDYLIKPFEMAELFARINALYRRTLAHHQNAVNGKLSAGQLVIDTATRQVTLNGLPIELTSMEFDMLVILVAKEGKLVARSVLANLLYPIEAEPDSNSLDVLLARLRKKLTKSDIRITTVRSKGFILNVATSAN